MYIYIYIYKQSKDLIVLSALSNKKNNDTLILTAILLKCLLKSMFFLAFFLQRMATKIVSNN